MTKNDMASVSKNDGGAAKTRLSGESPAGDVDALVERLRRHVAEHDGGNGLLTHIEAGDFTQAAEALTSLRAELDEGRAQIELLCSQVRLAVEGAQPLWSGDYAAAEARALKAEAENKALRQALEPFAKIVPSSFYAADGSEGEGYRIYLEAQPQHIAFTGSDIAKAREALLPPSESQ